MTTVDLPVSKGTTFDAAVRHMEQVLRHSYLIVSPQGPMKAYDQSMHWHATEAGATGTLEATVAVDKGDNVKAWLSWHDNRFGPWIHDAVLSLQQLWEESE